MQGFDSSSLAFSIPVGPQLAALLSHPASDRQRAAQARRQARGPVKSDSCGVRTHALTDWRLEPAP